MLRLADVVIRFRWLIITATLLITGYLGWKMLSVSFNADFSTYLSQDDPTVREYNRIGDIFGGNDIGIVLLSTDEIFTHDNLELIDRLTDAYKKVEGINYVTSLSNVINFRVTGLGLDVGHLYKRDNVPFDSADLDRLRNYILKNDRFVGNLVTRDSKIAAILLQFKGGKTPGNNQFLTSLRVKNATNAVMMEMQNPPNGKLYYGGLPFLVYNMTLLIGNNLSTLIPIMIILLVFILYIGFRHWAGVTFPLIVVGISTSWVTGLMGLLGWQFDLLTGIMPVVLLALGSADGIHLMKRYYELRSNGLNPAEATRQTFQYMGMPIILTTVTTMVGFASLFVSDFSVIRQFGLLTALGVLLALMVTLTLLPALLSFGIGYRMGGSHENRSYGKTERFGKWLFNHKKWVIATSIGVVGIALIAIPRVKKDVDWSLCLAKGSDPYHAEMLLRGKFGGSLPVQIVVGGDLKDPAILQWMQRIERRIEMIPEVDKSRSMAGILAEMNKVLNDRYRVPEKPQGVSNLWFLVEGEDDIKRLVTPSADLGLIQAKLATWHTGTLVASVNSINDYLQTLPDTISVINLSRLQGITKQQVRQEQLRDALHELSWYLDKQEIKRTPETGIKLRNLLNKFTVDAAVRTKIRKDLNEYLESPEAEITLTPYDQDRLLNRLNHSIGQDSLSVSLTTVSHQIVETLPNINREDAEWLGGSLTQIINSVIREASVSLAVTLLEKVTGLKDPDIIKNVKGILWGVNNQYAFIDSKITEKILNDSSTAIKRQVPFSVHQAGMPQVLKGMEEELTPTQIESLLTALLFVLVLLAVIFRSTVVALLAIIPISLTIIINFGVMGYLGIGLDSFTAMIASIAIGLGIDTDIHFITRFKEELVAHGDKLKALQITLKTTGLSILINALAVGLGFMVLLFAGGQHIRRFGGLTAMTVLVSAVFSLTLLAVMISGLSSRFLVQRMVTTKERQTSIGKNRAYEKV